VPQVSIFLVDLCFKHRRPALADTISIGVEFLVLATWDKMVFCPKTLIPPRALKTSSTKHPGPLTAQDSRTYGPGRGNYRIWSRIGARANLRSAQKSLSRKTCGGKWQRALTRRMNPEASADDGKRWRGTSTLDLHSGPELLIPLPKKGGAWRGGKAAPRGLAHPSPDVPWSEWRWSTSFL